MNETGERFLNAILERLGSERIVEIHLFPPIRQGRMETGVAVVAATRRAEEQGGHSGTEPEGEGLAAEPEGEGLAAEPGGEGLAAEPGGEGLVAEPEGERLEAKAAGERLEVWPEDGRLEVLTAWYRLTRKGPDRGKWEVDLKVEADAPLATVGAVVRGVQQRLGEAVEPERFPAERLRALQGEATHAASEHAAPLRGEPAPGETAWRTSRY